MSRDGDAQPLRAGARALGKRLFSKRRGSLVRPLLTGKQYVPIPEGHQQ